MTCRKGATSGCDPSATTEMMQQHCKSILERYPALAHQTVGVSLQQCQLQTDPDAASSALNCWLVYCCMLHPQLCPCLPDPYQECLYLHDSTIEVQPGYSDKFVLNCPFPDHNHDLWVSVEWLVYTVGYGYRFRTEAGRVMTRMSGLDTMQRNTVGSIHPAVTESLHRYLPLRRRPPARLPSALHLV